MKRILLATVAMAAFATGQAVAADLPAYAPPAKAPAYVAPMYNWSGPYVGVNLGGAWTDSNAGSNIGGFIYGAQIGINWQAAGSPFVFGLEADFQGSTQKETANNVFFLGDSATAKLPWFGTVRGRLGYAFDRAMIYATGGLAYQHLKFDYTLPGFGTASASTTEAGWTLGGGFEWAMWDNWTVKAEYLYIDTNGNDVATPLGPVSFDRVKNHVVRAGLNYRF